MTDLSQKHCQTCQGDTPPLKPDQIRAFLKELQPDWSLIEDKKIERTFKFKNFREAMAFTNRVAELAESEGHHPDINLHGWNKVTITLSTHAIGGLSENDFIVARKIETLLKLS